MAAEADAPPGSRRALCRCALSQRQWCGRLGKIDNCQVGVFLAYVSAEEQALVDTRLYLPKSWARSKKRRAKAGVPAAVKFRTRHELALGMLDGPAAALPPAWGA